MKAEKDILMLRNKAKRQKRQRIVAGRPNFRLWLGNVGQIYKWNTIQQ